MTVISDTLRAGLSRRFFCRRQSLSVFALMLFGAVYVGFTFLTRSRSDGGNILAEFQRFAQSRRRIAGIDEGRFSFKPIYIDRAGSPSYASVEERLSNIAASFHKDGLEEDLCEALRNGQIVVDKRERRGGKKVVRRAMYGGKVVILKRNDFPYKLRLNESILMDEDKDGAVSRWEFFRSISNVLDRMGMYQMTSPF